MKSLFLSFLVFFSVQSMATVDANTKVYILVKDINTEEFLVERAPVIGCWGIAKGPELEQLTREYVVNNLGCGSVSQENINALTCAKVEKAVESDDFSTFKEITLNISKCADKDNKDFIDSIKKVVKLNFATKEIKNPTLFLVK